jgi:succinate dehydrogenase/fumarate reductase flavoprotein subunit
VSEDPAFDVVVVGSGAGGLATAVTAARGGLKVLVLEKQAHYGGTTARSGGVLWIPCNAHSRALGIEDSLDEARRYLVCEAGAAFDPARVDAFLAQGPRMVDFFERETQVRFVPVPAFSDYHPARPGGRPGGRSILAAPFDARELGPEAARLAHPLRDITFVGMMFNASEEVSHFFNATRSLRSAAYVTRRLLTHAFELARHGRAQRLTNGNALAARLARSAFDAGVMIVTQAPVIQLCIDGGRVTGVQYRAGAEVRRATARHGVVLASGGFPQNAQLRARLFPHRRHHSPASPGNTGDGWQMAQAVGAATRSDLANNAAWIPVSLVPRGHDAPGVFPHLIDRYKPGIIAVDLGGRRFVNEADSYHDVGQAMQRSHPDAEAWLIADHRAIRRYGLGFAKPFPLPLWPHLRSGYLLRGASIALLAHRMAVDPAQLERTLEDYNAAARVGLDPAFGKGGTAYNRFLGDRLHQPNPCVAPLETPPFYAVKLRMGDLGTFAGIQTDETARVLTAEGVPVPGLYAVGNDALSIMGGAYPGGGITLGPALTFGYIAGLELAKQARRGHPAAASGRARAPAPSPEAVET